MEHIQELLEVKSHWQKKVEAVVLRKNNESILFVTQQNRDKTDYAILEIV